jgi:DNA-binding transcriptional MerR regulator
MRSWTSDDRGTASPTVDGALRSGQLAASVGVSHQTLRYYERRGLLQPASRTLGGHRVYQREAVTVLRVIKTAQKLGFSLNEVAELLDAHQRGTGLADRAAAKLAEVEAKIVELNEVADTLRSVLAAGCDDLVSCADDPEPDCPLPFQATSHETSHETSRDASRDTFRETVQDGLGDTRR